MSLEQPALSPSEKIDLMGPEEKIGLLFSVFDIGKDKDKNEERKRKFIELIGRYFNSLKQSRAQEDDNNDSPTGKKILVKGIIEAQSDRHQIHKETMLAIRSASISLERYGDPLLNSLFAKLAQDQKEMERLIIYYFSGRDTVKPSSDYLGMKRNIDSINYRDIGPEEE